MSFQTIKELITRKQTRKLLLLILVISTVVAIPLAVYQAQKQQETRQRANVQSNPHVAIIEQSSRNSDAAVTINNEFTVEVVLHPEPKAIIAIEIPISFDSNQLELTQRFTPTTLFSEVANRPGPTDPLSNAQSVYFAGTNNGSVLTAGTIGTMKFKAKALAPNGTTIKFGSATIPSVRMVALGGREYTPLGINTDAVITIVSTPITSIPVSPSISPLQADVNRNGCVNMRDYEIWKQAYLTSVIQQGTYPDINNDSKVDLLDFNIWYNAMLSLPAADRCSRLD